MPSAPRSRSYGRWVVLPLATCSVVATRLSKSISTSRSPQIMVAPASPAIRRREAVSFCLRTRKDGSSFLITVGNDLPDGSVPCRTYVDTSTPPVSSFISANGSTPHLRRARMPRGLTAMTYACAFSVEPTGWGYDSTNVVSYPRSVRVLAARAPAGPPPTMRHRPTGGGGSARPESPPAAFFLLLLVPFRAIVFVGYEVITPVAYTISRLASWGAIRYPARLLTLA
mmetsp:Transcript_12306/g.28994  ORF Transcript_12306/g.28994 Transcript_12306/m.28994 type:complete len:227 (-) Transcript_12306:121-801(-)